jgi:glycosyltransferase involved in cell wall biosynthesis
MNYTNFHIVYIDDNSPNNEVYKIYEYLKNANMRLKNRIKIVHNLQKLNNLINLYVYSKKYCNDDNIVVFCDADDSLLGRQTLKLLNYVYQDENIWFVHTQYARKHDGEVLYGVSARLSIHANEVRRTRGYWPTSHLRTTRKKVINSIPIESLMYYLYDSKNGRAFPRFYKLATDVFLTFPML